jgi:hypothetical protein
MEKQSSGVRKRRSPCTPGQPRPAISLTASSIDDARIRSIAVRATPFWDRPPGRGAPGVERDVAKVRQRLRRWREILGDAKILAKRLRGSGVSAREMLSGAGRPVECPEWASTLASVLRLYADAGDRPAPNLPADLHAVVQDQVDARPRHEHRQPSQERHGIEEQSRRPITPGLSQQEPHRPVGGQIQAIHRDRRPQNVSAYTFESLARPGGDDERGVQPDAGPHGATPTAMPGRPCLDRNTGPIGERT